MGKLLPVFFFGAIFTVYVAGVTPDMTWFSLGGDQFDYVVATENFQAARPTSYPLLVCLGWLFELLPGNPFWNLALLSAVSTMVACVFIFLLVRHLVLNRSGLGAKLAPYVGAAAYASSFPVWTQSVIPEVYTLAAMLMVVAVYLVVTRHFYWAAAVFGLSLGSHHLIAFAIFPCLVYIWYLRRQGEVDLKFRYVALLGALGLLLYLQPLLFVGDPQETSNGLGVAVSQSGGTLPMIGQLPMTYVPSRSYEFLVLLLPGVGAGLLLLGFIPRSKETWLLLVMALGPLVYYYVSIPPQWATFVVPGVAFLAVLLGVGAAYFPVAKAVPVVLALMLVGVGMNLYHYDIGRSVDPAPTTARQMYEDLDRVPDGAYVYTHTWGHGWMLIYYYCVEHDWRFTMVNQGGLLYQQPWYLDEMDKRGVVLPDYEYMNGIPGGFLWNTPETAKFDMYEFLTLIVQENPDKDFWVCYLEEENDPIKFNVAPVVRNEDGTCDIHKSAAPIMISERDEE